MVNYSQEGILFPDAAVIDGKSVDVLVTSPRFKSFDTKWNMAAGGIISVNLKCGKSATVTIKFVDKDNNPVVVPAAARAATLSLGRWRSRSHGTAAPSPRPARRGRRTGRMAAR